jgi:hypothetical protein
MGRPSIYTEELAERICEQIADGKSLRTICLGDDMPNRGTVFRWLAQSEAADKVFSNQYAHARQVQADVLFEEILEIADEEVTMVKRSKHQHGASPEDDTPDNEVEVVFDPTAVQRNRLRVDSRKWMAGKLRPKKYGEKLDLSHSGSIKHQLTDLSDDDLALIAAGGGN